MNSKLKCLPDSPQISKLYTKYINHLRAFEMLPIHAVILLGDDGIPPEFFIVTSELVHDDTVRLSRLQSAVEQSVHRLERHALGLWHQEEDKDGGKDHERCEEEVDAVAHGGEHLRGEASDEEVPEPVVGGCKGLSEGTDGLIEHLGVVDPGCAVPRRRVEGGPEIEEEHGGNATAGEGRRGVFSRLGHGDVGSNVPHADGPTDSTNHEQETATQFVDKEEEPNDSYDGFDDTKDAGSEKGSVSAGDADGFKDSWRVVIDGIDAGCVLPEEKSTTKEEAPEDFAISDNSAERVPEAEAHGGLLMLEGAVNGL